LIAYVDRLKQERHECRILMRKLTGEWSFKRSRIIWEDITNMKEIDWKDERKIILVQDRVHERTFTELIFWVLPH
jgi:hypothetical protein